MNALLREKIYNNKTGDLTIQLYFMFPAPHHTKLQRFMQDFESYNIFETDRPAYDIFCRIVNLMNTRMMSNPFSCISENGSVRFIDLLIYGNPLTRVNINSNITPEERQQVAGLYIQAFDGAFEMLANYAKFTGITK